jgi:AraC-like DNA-binding protein
MLKMNPAAHHCAMRRSHGKRHQSSYSSCLMLHPPVTIPIAFVRGMLSGVRARGQPCDIFLADAGISPGLLEHASARVTAAQYVALFRTLIDRLDDEGLGFFSRPLKRGSFALIARTAISAHSLEQALRRISRTFGLLQDDVTCELVTAGATAGLALHFRDASMHRPAFFDEMLLRVFWRLLAWLVGGELRAVRFDFAFECPPYASSYNKVFPAPQQFAQRRSAFWFDAARLRNPVRRDKTALRSFLIEAQSNIVLPRRGEDMISARVRNHLQRTQPGWPDLIATAEALHMSTATLQRRLASEGTSFQSLKDTLRRDVAIVRLNTSTVPLGTLAFELGFSDSAAFQRAFKGWTGSAPGAYRHRDR